MHESERTYHDWKVDQLADEYGAENVQTEYRLQTGRVVDILVTDPNHRIRWAYELENDKYNTLNGSGQAQYYAARAFTENPFGGPVYPALGVPAGHIDRDEKIDLEGMGVRVDEDDLPDDVSPEGV